MHVSLAVKKQGPLKIVVAPDSSVFSGAPRQPATTAGRQVLGVGE
jgi:hypothetical protein